MRNVLFLCRILASATHEMQNILAVIKESGALALDVLNLNGPPRMKHGDKLFSALETLDAQVERGRALMMALNTCAHAAAAECEVLELSVFCDRAAVLSERMARLKECSLKFVKGLDKGQIRADGFDFLQSVYRAVELVLAGCRPGDTLTLALRATENGQAVVRVASESSRVVPPSDADFDAMAARIGAQSRPEAGALSLILPLASGE